MRLSRSAIIAILGLTLLLLITFGWFGRWIAPITGGAGATLQHYLVVPWFTVGGIEITAFFVIKALIFFVALIMLSHFSMIFLHKKVLRRTPLSASQQYSVARILSYLIFILGMVVGLQSLGVNLSSLVVIGSALGIGVGLGLQGVVSNFVAGLVLLLEQPIKIGDRIEIGETYGDVVRMQGRSTWVRTNENVVIIVPNSEFIDEKVINWTANDRQVRVALPFGVSYNADPQCVREVVMRAAGQNSDVLREPAPEVIFLGFGDSSLDFELRVWTVQQVQTPARLKSDLYFSLFAAFAQEKIEIPFPQRDLHVRSVSAQLTRFLIDESGKRHAS